MSVGWGQDCYENITEAECWNTCSGAITEGTCTGADDPAVPNFPQPDNEADCLDSQYYWECLLSAMHIMLNLPIFH